MRELQTDELLQKFKYPLTKPSKQWWILFIAMCAVFGIGIFALVKLIIEGHIITGMRDHVVWGVFIVNFIFFIGLSYAGSLISCGMHLANIKWGRPLTRIVEFFTFITICIGPLFIFLCVGRLDRLHHLFIYARIQSPITWDVIAILTDLIFCGVYLYITLIRAFAMLRDTTELDIPAWKRKIYKWLAIGYNGKPKQIQYLNQAQNVLAAIIIPTSIIAYSLLAWLFGMNLRTGWHSTLFAPHFVLTAVFSGIALLVIMMWIYRKIYNLEKHIKDQYFQYLGYSLLLLIFAWGYFTLSEYITEWYNMSKTAGIWIGKFTDVSQYGYFSFVTILCTMLIPLIVLGIPKLRTVNNITFISVLIVFGLWVRRYLIIVPTLETPYIPIRDVRPEVVHYQATWIEWVLTLAGIALFVIMIQLLNLFVPAVPVAKLEHEEEVSVPEPFYKTIETG
jgi:molybdopterin-containing oxidoreductase family membrane subunit